MKQINRHPLTLLLVVMTLVSCNRNSPEKHQPQTTEVSIKNPVYIFYEHHSVMNEIMKKKMDFIDNSPEIYREWVVIEEGRPENFQETSISPSGKYIHLFFEDTLRKLSDFDTIKNTSYEQRVKDWCSTRIHTAEQYTEWPYTDQAKKLKNFFYENCPLSNKELEEFRSIRNRMFLVRENEVLRKCIHNQDMPTIIGFGAAHLRLTWILGKELKRNVESYFIPQESLKIALPSAVVTYLIFEDKEFFSY